MAFRDDGFFHALQQHPDDDSLRLIYADSLEECGDAASVARSEFIRIQVALATPRLFTRRTVADTAALTVRQDELLAEWERVWLAGWADALDGWTFRRGFLEAVQADASVFLDAAEDWFAEWPTLTVAKLTRAGGHLPELAASPWLAHLRGLDLSDSGIGPDLLACLTTSRFIPLLQALDLSGNPLGERGAEQLAFARSADDLSELHLARCGLGRKGLDRLLDGRSRQWRRFDLSNNDIYRHDLIRLADSPVMARLAALDLRMNPLRDHGATALADSPNVSNLVDLGLSYTGIGDQELAAIARSPHLRRLRSLDLRDHACSVTVDRAGIDQGGMSELARSPLLGQLQRLLLGSSFRRSSWTAEVLSISRVPVCTVEEGWEATILRNSHYLMPSQLLECDLADLWWLGDTGNRERVPNGYDD